MTHDDSSKPEVDPADAAEAIDDESTTEAQASTVSLTKDDEATADEAPAESETVSLSKDDGDEAEERPDGDSADDSAADDSDADDAAAVEDPDDPKPVRVDNDEPSARKPLASLVLAAAVAALIAAVVCLGYFGYTGVRAYTVDSTATQLRDESLDAAQQAVLNITAVDPTDIAGWEKRLKSSLTGEALEQVKPNDLKQLVDQGQAAGAKAGKIESKIARSAVTALNTDEDSATVLVFANVTATNKNQPIQQSQMGFLLTMVDVDGTRKANKVVALNPLEYSQAGSNVTSDTGNGTEPKEGGN